MNGALSYTRYELLRVFRNARFFIFSLGFPLVLYYVIAGGNKNVSNLNGSGISAPLYFMVGLASFGTMNAILAAGARISPERAVGWNRQLRITPLSVRAYFRAKVISGYLMALLTLALLYAAGISLGVLCVQRRRVPRGIVEKSRKCMGSDTMVSDPSGVRREVAVAPLLVCHEPVSR